MTTGLVISEAGSGPPVVLVHAGVADGRMWDPQVELLSGTYRVVVPDLRGFGRTALPDRPFAHASELEALSADLGIERAVWIGCSMGGMAVLDLALAAPALVSALVLIDCVPSGYRVTDPITQQGWAAAEEAYAAGEMRRAAEIEMEMWLVGPGRDPSEVSGELQDLVVTMVLDSYRHGEGEERGPPRPALDHLEEISVPTLVMAGLHDQADFRKAAETLAARMPKARLEIVEDAAHLPSLEQPLIVNELLAGFLAEKYH